MKLVEGEIYCENHGTVHEETNDPYQYGYELSGETPECGPQDWRKLWLGAFMEKTSARGS